MSKLIDLMEKLYQGEELQVIGLVKDALEEGVPPSEILQNGLIAGMDHVGKDFKSGELFVPEVLLSARAMKAGLDILRPYLVEGEIVSAGKVVMGTVKGDLHDIGKNLVCMMLEGAGFEVVDLGIDVTPESFVKAIQDHSPNVIGMSAMLTTTMPYMKATIDSLEVVDLRDQVKVIIGGAPVTAAYSNEIGADGFASDAASAVERIRELIP